MNRLIGFAFSALVVLQGMPAAAQCAGDCDGSGDVGVNELISGVNIALGNSPLSSCRGADGNGDGEITVNELIAAVGNALNGCPQGGTPTRPPSTPTPTPTAGIPGIDPRLFGTFKGPGVDTITGQVREVRVRVANENGSIVVTDLGGNLFGGGSLTVQPLTSTSAMYVNMSGGMVATLSIGLAADGEHLTGNYATTTLTFPPVASATAFTLERES